MKRYKITIKDQIRNLQLVEVEEQKLPQALSQLMIDVISLKENVVVEESNDQK